jgi:hypothetical protein
MNRISFSKSLGYLIILSFSIVSVSAQVSQKIGNNPGTINPNAVLELESITQGFLMPRMTAAQMAAITTPTSGMIIFCTDCGSGSDGELRISYSGVWQTFKGNLTGNISGNAATVTTNANLTGPITSVGNTTFVASQTGTGSKFVMDTAPTLVTPVLGVATATSVTSPIYASTPQALASGAAITWNPANGLNAAVTLDQNSTLNFSATPTAGTYGTLIITQDATGGRTLTLPSTANKVLGSSSTTTIALSSAPSAKDILNFYYDGTNCYWNIGQGYGIAATIAPTSLTSGVAGTLPVANGGTGSTTQNFVDVTTAQTVAGNKTFTGTTSGITAAMVGLGNVTNTSDANKPVSTATQTALDLKANLASPTFTGTPTAPTATAGTNTTQLATTAFVTAATAASAGVSGSGTLNYIPKFSSATAIGNSSISEDGTGLRIGNPNGQGGVYTGLNTDNNTRLMVTGGREFESIKMAFPGDPYNNELSFNWYNSAWRMRTERSSADITDLSFWRTAGGVTTEQMRLTSQGNLGIGTNSPTEKLHVSGNVKATGFKTTTGTSSQFLKADGSVDTNAYLTASTAGTNFLPLSGGTLTGSLIGTTASFGSDISINSTKFGRGAGSVTTSRNIAIGNSSLTANTTGTWNTAIGTYALQGITTGSANTAIGNEAISMYSGSNNTGLGSRALMYTSGSGNSSVGTNALINSTTGNNNTAIGLNAFSTNTTGSNNTAIGAATVVSSVGLTNATAIGYGATVATDDTIQLGNTSVTAVNTSGAITGASFIKSGGTSSQFLKADGSIDSATYLTTAGTATNVSGVVAVANGGTGSATKNFVDLTSDQTILGNKTFINNFQVGSGDNTSFPMKYGQLNSDNAQLSFGFRGKEFRAKVNQNSGILEKLTYSYFNGTTDVEAMRIDNNSRVTIGGVTYPNTTGTANQVLTTNGSGVASWATPASSGVPYTGATGAVNLGAYNLTVNGLTVGKGNGSLSDNTAFGSGALAQTSGNSNTAIGSSALYNNGAGYANTAIGYGAGYSNGSGTYNIMIGYNANMSGLSGGVTNSIAIGNSIDVTTSNTIQLGNSSVTDLKTFGKITSGTITYPNTFGSANQVLTTNGSGVASWATPTSVSEADEQLFATAAQTSFTLAQTPRVLSKVKMYVNGIKINKLAYSVSGPTVTYVPANNNNYAISLNDRVQFEYTY